ncbi:major facilitator superfamily protein, putative [Ichthyophthirius multifiliis]|uniref:Lysosomal dipeptide transporter MFSD1 n=1 Tax=Ichthyophthirius multifiliis TaxID=5932 RepID=G0QSK7_ICHMU|nr:major facilitator superfamily protein, putative [Ichthyophthirius multifiliis]EGR31799.1 major facilitator superfamily protein, putative [Ichthyophthirius multifiliis]|eukprot:XP_004035285.1 major facilitator superfamily protein, putative [Ichthyophthirius multifiliis]
MQEKKSRDYLIDYDEDLIYEKKTMRQTNWRWYALFLMCFMVLGSYMCYDFPAILNSQIQKDLKQTSTSVNILYSVYSLPNIVLPLFGGYLLDYLGIRKGIFIFTLILLLGQFTCSIGVNKSTQDFKLLIIGRVLYGLGGEVLLVAQSIYIYFLNIIIIIINKGTIISKWFKHNEQSFAFGLSITIIRLGQVFGGFLFPVFQKSYKQLFYPLIFGTSICFFSWICGLKLIYLDRKADLEEYDIKKKKIGNQLDDENNQQQDISIKNNYVNKSEEEQELKFLQKLKNKNKTLKDTKVNIKDLKLLKFSFWLLSFSTLFFILLFIVFLSIFKINQLRFIFLQKIRHVILNIIKQFILQYLIYYQNKAYFLILPSFIGAVLTPILGLIIDKIGKRVLFIMISSLILILSHILILVLSPVYNNVIKSNADYIVIIPLTLYGISLSLNCAILWPCFPIICKAKIIGIAFGINTCVYNAGLVIVPIIAGKIIEINKEKLLGYFYYQVFFIFLSCCSFLINAFMYFYDIKYNYKKLDKSYFNQPLNPEDSYLKNSQAIFVRRAFRI